MRRLVITGLPLNATGRTRRRNFWQLLTRVQRANRLHLMNDDTADSLSECISTASYRMSERLRRSCYRSPRPRMSLPLPRMPALAHNHCWKQCKLASSHLINVVATPLWGVYSLGATRPERRTAPWLQRLYLGIASTNRENFQQSVRLPAFALCRGSLLNLQYLND